MNLNKEWNSNYIKKDTNKNQINFIHKNESFDF